MSLRDITDASFMSYVDQHATLTWDRVLEEYVFAETVENGRIWRWLVIDNPNNPKEKVRKLIETNDKYHVN